MAINPNASTYWSSLNNGKFVNGIGELDWNSLSPQAQQAVSDYYTSTVLPRLSGKSITGYDGRTTNVDSLMGQGGYTPTAGASIFDAQNYGDNAYTAGRSGLNDTSTMDGYSGLQRLPQASLLYAINPQLAESLGITKDTAIALANQNNDANEAGRHADDAAGAREGWLMALAAAAPAAWQYATGANGAASTASQGLSNDAITNAISEATQGTFNDIAAQQVGSGAFSDAALTTAAGGGSALAPLVNGAAPSALKTIGSTLGSAAGGVAEGLLGKGAGALAAAGLGGLLGGTNGAKQAGTTTTTQEPWSAQQPYLKGAWDAATNQFNSTNPITTQANANYQSLLGGNTTNPMLGLDNPYLQSAIDSAQNDVVRQATGAFNNANRVSGSFGNSGLQEAFARELPRQLGNISTNMRMQDYGSQQQLNENAVNRTTAATSNANTYAWQPVQNYANVVGAQNWGGSQSSPYYTNQNANILGGMMTGANIYNSLFGNK